MSERDFFLIPFSAERESASFQITGKITRRGCQLSLDWTLQGKLAEVEIPLAAEKPERRDKLWEKTCFEFFLSPHGASSYWEFNLSPSGSWNVYRFDAYRSGMREEERLTALPFAIDSGTDALRVAVEASLDSFIGMDEPLEAGISAVIRLRGGGTEFWALAHPGPAPDFHRRESFLIRL